MGGHSRPTVVLLSSAGTLGRIDVSLAREGIRLVRIPTVVPEAVDSRPWKAQLTRFPEADTVVVTSPAAVRTGVEPWRRSSVPFPSSPEFWAAGPGTVLALRKTGLRRVRRPRTVGALAVARALDGEPRRTVVYLRSDRAGPRLARVLRSQGHRVLDLVVYRIPPTLHLSSHARRALAATDLLVATSPSSLSNLRRVLDRRTFSHLCESAPLVVLGDRSRRAARGHGFRHVSVAPSTTAQRFTRHLLHELRDAHR
jgi:uroporphyrinogen-III synthase